MASQRHIFLSDQKVGLCHSNQTYRPSPPTSHPLACTRCALPHQPPFWVWGMPFACLSLRSRNLPPQQHAKPEFILLPQQARLVRKSLEKGSMQVLSCEGQARVCCRGRKTLTSPASDLATAQKHQGPTSCSEAALLY